MIQSLIKRKEKVNGQQLVLYQSLVPINYQNQIFVLLIQFLYMENQYISFRLQSVKLMLAKLAENVGCDSFSGQYRRISQFLGYFARFQQILGRSNQAPENLFQCVSLLKYIVQSSTWKRYTDLYCKFKYLKKKFQGFVFKTLNLTENRIQIRRNQNKNSGRLQILNQVSKYEEDYLQLGNIQNFLVPLIQDEIVVNDPKCICCSRVFIKNSLIFNENTSFPVCVGLNARKAADVQNIRKTICAVFNSGGGVIIIGTKKHGDIVRAKGVIFQNENEKNLMKKKIYGVLSEVRPTFKSKNVLVQEVLVHSSCIKPKNIHKQSYRICFRIKISQVSQVAYYLENDGANSQKIYYSYFFNKQQKIEKLGIKKIQDETKNSIYEYIHHHRKAVVQPKEYISSHKSIKCYKAYPFFSKIYLQYIQQIQKDKNYITEQEPSSSEQELKYEDDIGQQKFKNISFLLISKKKQQQIYREIKQHFQSKDIPLTFQKPYDKSFNKQNFTREVYMVSHEMNFIQFKQHLKDLNGMSIIKLKDVTCMPVYNNFEIQSENKNYSLKRNQIREKLKKLQERFQTKYKHLQYINDKKQKRSFYTFKSFRQAAYAYLIFQQFGLNVYFMNNENQPFLKDPNLKNLKYI